MNNVKPIRRAKGLTQKEVALRAGMSVSDVSRIESRNIVNVSLRNARRISKALETSIDELWPEDEIA